MSNRFCDGDIVRVVSSSKGWDCYVTDLDGYIGSVGEIIYSHDNDVYRIDFGDNKYCWNFPGGVLELVDHDLVPGDLPGLFGGVDS